MAKVDFNSTCKVNVTLACVCSQCRLCKLQNLIKHGNVLPMVEIETVCPDFQRSRVYYCPECYAFLRERLIDPKTMPELSEVRKDLQVANVPLYSVKNDDPMKLAYPEDEIDLGLWRKRRTKQRQNN